MKIKSILCAFSGEAALSSGLAHAIKLVSNLTGVLRDGRPMSEQQSRFVKLDLTIDGPLSEFARGFDLIVTSVHSEAVNETHLTANHDVIRGTRVPVSMSA